MFLKRNFNHDRRRGKRQLLNTSVRVFTDTVCLDALGINISERGMCLFAVAHLPLNSQLQIEFPLPRSKERLRLSGTVRHRALYLYGIEFFPAEENSSESWEAASTNTGQPLVR